HQVQAVGEVAPLPGLLGAAQADAQLLHQLLAVAVAPDQGEQEVADFLRGNLKATMGEFAISQICLVQRRRSSSGHMLLRGILNKAFNIPRDQTVSAWTAVKDSLNRLGPESTFRKRKAGD
uniref:RPAP3_C domain-containing protein n=1 Tax=Macrostomum lignano TaxID=282301 RepID=A0A1I8FWK9_9PLAT